MIKYICVNDYGNQSYKRDCIYYIDLVLDDYIPIYGSKYFEVYTHNMKYIGGWWADVSLYFIPLSQYREEQINEILND